MNTHYIRCIWGWLLRVPSQGYQHFTYDYQGGDACQTETFLQGQWLSMYRKEQLGLSWFAIRVLNFKTFLPTRTKLDGFNPKYPKNPSKLGVILRTPLLVQTLPLGTSNRWSLGKWHRFCGLYTPPKPWWKSSSVETAQSLNVFSSSEYLGNRKVPQKNRSFKPNFPLMFGHL